jgi:F420-dependent oxidoreductase-like protein
MRVCLMIEGQEGVSWDEWIALAEACEESGLEGLFRSDHYLGIGDRGGGSLDAWATLSALAATTERIRLGTMVSPATFRHPSVLAKAAVTADHVSGGRIELGLGAGWFETEHRAYGFPFPGVRERVERFAEQLEIVHRQWTEDEFDFDGRYYRLEDCRALPKPLQQPRPPLIVGGSGGRGTIEPAVRFADEYNTFFADLDACRDRRRKLDEACERAGRDPASIAFSLMTTCVVGADESELEARLRVLVDRSKGFSADAPPVISGTVGQVVERLGALEAVGVERVMLQHLAHDDVEMVRLLGAEVAPAVAS